MLAGHTPTLPAGSVVLAVDRSFAKGNWYSGRRVDPSTNLAVLYEVGETGDLKELLRDTTPGWARKLTGWLVTERPDLPRVIVRPPARR